MSKVDKVRKAIIKMLDKLPLEAKAVNPIVKEASQAGGQLLKEGQLAQGQKIVQKLPSAEEYKQKINSLKRVAGITGAIGASSFLSQEEAQAAGISTIMKKLGVTKEVAQEIKAMAQNVPPDVFEENIKAIQDVSRFKRDPESMSRLGKGIDVEAYDAGDTVVKAPRLGKLGQAWNSERMNIIPSIVEDTGLGVKTKTVKTSKNKYQVQEKLNLLDKIGADHPLLVNDKKLNDLSDKELSLMFNEKGQRLPETPELDKVRKQKIDREIEIFNQLNIPKEVLDKDNIVDSDKLELYLKRKLNQKVGSVFEPRDLHTENVGLDKQGQMKILDTGNFMQLDKSKLTPSMKSRAIQNYIALPEEKAAFKQSLENVKQAPSGAKKAAAIAPMAITPESFNESAINQLKNVYTTIRKPVIEGLNKVGDFIADTTRIPIEQSEEAKQQQRDISRVAAQTLLDPVNLVSGGGGAALGLADFFLNEENEDLEENNLKTKQDVLNKLR